MPTKGETQRSKVRFESGLEISMPPSRQAANRLRGARRETIRSSIRAHKEYRPKSREEISRNMSAIRSKGNRTEAMLRSRLHALGLRYRLYVSDLPGRPDIVFRKERVAVFVDGDFWHGRVLIEQGVAALRARLRTPSRQYWLLKFQRRVVRDRQITEELNQMGWLVMRFWETDLRKQPEQTAERVAAAVRRRRKLKK